MDLKWLEDFVSFAVTRSFSRSAELRHVTQPALSRRIQSLEDWAGVKLVDRGAQPLCLTPAGETFYPYCVQVVGALGAARLSLQALGKEVDKAVNLAAISTVVEGVVPKFMLLMQQALGTVRCQFMSLGWDEAALKLGKGTCDLLLAFCSENHPNVLISDKFESVKLVDTSFELVVSPLVPGCPFAAGTAGGTGMTFKMPYLAFCKGSYMESLTSKVLHNPGLAVQLASVFESDSFDSLKAMALQGLGATFLPRSEVLAELQDGRLVLLAPQVSMLSIPAALRVYRKTPSDGESRKAVVGQIWGHLGAWTDAVP